MSGNTYSILHLLLIGFIGLTAVRSAVLGVDFGGEFIKASTILPGKSFSIVEDTTSKRKTPSSIAFTNSERVYEWATLAKRSKNYQTTFVYLQKYLGKYFNDTQLAEQAKQYWEDYKWQENERGTINFSLNRFKLGHDDEDQYALSVEELVAMMFKNIQQLANDQANRQMKDIIVTIPPWWGFEERVALSDALEIAGLNPIGFVSENTAAALYYSLERQDNEPHTVIFYNLGSAGLKVSLVEFELVNSTSKTEKGKIESFRVLAEAWDEEVNSRKVDLALAQKIGEMFDAMPSRKGQKSIFTSNSGKSKLQKESQKVKETLSANKNVPIYIEGLFDSTDFKGSLDRKTLEELNAEMLSQLTKPIDEVLQKTGKTLADINAFEILGGGIRIPKVQQILAEYLGSLEVGAHLNGDESMALGAAFYAANMSSSFKTRTIYGTDGYNFDIRVDLKNLNSDVEEPLEKGTTLFPYKTKLGSKKTLSFHYNDDFEASFYADVHGKGEELVTKFKVTGFKQAREDPKYKELGTPKITLVFRLNALGLIELVKAEAVYEETKMVEDKSASSKKDTKGTEEATKTESGEAQKSEGGENKATTESDETQSETTEKVLKPKTYHYPYTLTSESWIIGPGHMTEEQITQSKGLLSKIDQYEEEKKKLSKAKNTLESFIYRSREILEDEQFIQMSSEEEREKLSTLATENDDWLYSEEASKSRASEFTKKFNEMNGIAEKVQKRIEENEKRPKAVEKAQKLLNDLPEKLNQLKEDKPWIGESHFNTTWRMFNETSKWLEEKLDKQAELTITQDPAFTSDQLTKKVTSLKDQFNKIKAIPKPKPKNETSSTGGKKEPKFDFNSPEFQEWLKTQNASNFNFTGFNNTDGTNDGPSGENIETGETTNQENNNNNNETGEERKPDTDL